MKEADEPSFLVWRILEYVYDELGNWCMCDRNERAEGGIYRKIKPIQLKIFRQVIQPKNYDVTSIKKKVHAKVR